MRRPLFLVLALAAAAPAPAGAGGFSVDGVPASGVAGTVERQRSERGGVALSAAGREVRLAPWPWAGAPPRLVGQALRAVAEPHPEGPSTRLELGPPGGEPRWIFVARARGGAEIAGGVTLGAHVAMRGRVAEVLLFVGKAVVATPLAGRAERVRAGRAWWCIAVTGVDVPPPPTRGLSDDRREARVDVAARRLGGPRERCKAR